MSDLEARITRLEDIEAIKQLKARYAEICDDLHLLLVGLALAIVFHPVPLCLGHCGHAREVFRGIVL